jgi:hypothetical protein
MLEMAQDRSEVPNAEYYSQAVLCVEGASGRVGGYGGTGRIAMSHDSLGDAARRVKSICLLIAVLAASLTVAYAGAPEHVSIQTLYTQAPSFHLHSVTLQGVISELQLMPPTPTPGGKCRLLYWRGTFILDDGTGSLPVEMPGTCFLPPSPTHTPPQNGDLVMVTAVIHLLNTDLPPRLRGRATDIQILKSK